MAKRKQSEQGNKSYTFIAAIAAIAGIAVLAILVAVTIYFVAQSGHDEQDNVLANVEKIPIVNESEASEADETDSNYMGTTEYPWDSGDEDDMSDEDSEEPEEPEPLPTKVAYLTFDDGPARSITPGVLDVLAEEGIVATFFILPRDEVDDIFMRIIDEGHEIANHSYSHNYNRLYSGGIEAFTNDILRAHDFILDNFGYTMSIFRFPGGSMSWRADTVAARIEVLEELGYRHFDWHVDSGDASGDPDKSAPALTRRVLTGTNDIDHVIILMHDHRWRESTLEALPDIIRGLREQGYSFDIMRNFPGEAP